MSDHNLFPEKTSSLWIQNLVNGLSGYTIKAKSALYCNASPFQKIEVFDTYSFGRVLCLGGNIVMTETDDTYHEMMVHPAMMMHEHPREICCIGGGDGGCLKELLKYQEIKKVVIVEIDEMVYEAVRTFLPKYAEGFDDPRVELVFDDGYHYLKDATEKYDIMLVDSYDPGGPVQSLETEDFHCIVSQRVDEKGLTVFQTDSPVIQSAYLRSTIQKVSPFFTFYKPYICSIRSFPEGICSFLTATRHKENLDRFDTERYNKIALKCDYYNNEIHTGAFLLPGYLKKAIAP